MAANKKTGDGANVPRKSHCRTANTQSTTGTTVEWIPPCTGQVSVCQQVSVCHP